MLYQENTKKNFESLSDLNNKRVHTFEFDNKKVADNFAIRLFKIGRV